ncbi:hypothetical protein AAFF_G00418410 [Aldrovandia affinis]|uniref:Rab11 family-interacting protein 5 n=1 Tax=Aldrovandia affinis TaxID=143900 RepID=A0AAD7SAQ0_9TELE|nr:hypothetical protein AAFF_G00418410 [Aldrovandia affinis]
MSFINLDDDQRWVPTHVQVTVLRGRGLRAKGKHGTSDVYTVIQVGKEKFTTGVVEKTTAPEWTEECSFELLPGVLEVGGQGAYPSGSSDLVLTVMHRALIGPDAFLGHVVLPLDKVFEDRLCLRNEWYKLRSKSGRKEKERGELQVTVQFTRNNLTASMFDLSVKDKPRSAFGKLKDRVTGKKRGESETSSAIVPGGYAVLSGGGRRFSGDDYGEDDEGRRGKVKSFFLKGKLRRASDAQSSTSLASECSVTSSPGGSLSPTAGISMLVSDLSNSPSENSNHPADSSPVHPVQAPPKQMTHKRAFSDEASKITVALPRPRAVETLLAQSGALSRSSLCINGSHVYGAESLGPGSASTLPASLGLLQKCAPLSRSLQNLGRRADDPRRSPGSGRRWSFDRGGKEDKTAQAAAAPSSQAAQAPAPAVTAIAGADPPGEGKKQKRNLFSQGRSESAGKSDAPKVEQGQGRPLPEERHKGWFSAKDSHNKPSQEVSPMVETSTDALHTTPRSSNHLPPCCSPASASPGSVHSANPFTPSPATPPISPSNPFFTRLQCNPFYEELLADQALRSTIPTTPRPSSSPLWPSAASPSWSGTPSPSLNAIPQERVIAQRERPMCVSRQRSLPALLSGMSNSSANPFTTRSLSESGCEWDDSFEAFATSRLKSPRGPSHKTNAGHKEWPVGGIAEEINEANEPLALAAKAPPLPPRRPVRTPVKEVRRDSWLDRAQELAVKKEACLLSQTDAASMLHRREGGRRRNASCSSLSDREVQIAQVAKPLAKPSDSDPSSRRVQECPAKRCPGKSASLQRHGGLRFSGGDAKSLVWSHGLEQGPASVAPELDNESILNSTLEFFSLEGSEEFDGEDTTSSIFGEEVEDKVPSLLWEMDTNNSKISPGETQGAEPHSTATIQAHGFCTANQEKSDVTTAIALEPVPNVATVHPSTNGTKVIDLEVNKQVHNNNFGDSQLANTDSACSPPAMIDVFEINNNTDKDFNLSQSPRLLPTEVHTKKSHSLITDVFSNTAAVVSVDCGDEGGCTPFASAPFVGSKFGVTINAAELLILESDLAVSTQPVETLSSEVWGPPETAAEGDGIIGETTETECIHQPLTNSTSDVIVLLDSEAKDGSLLNDACCPIDPLLIELPREGECDNEEVSEPPPKPPRLFNEPMSSGHHQVNEGPEASQEASFCREDGCAEPGVEYPLSEGTQKISFEDLHAKVAPSLRNRSGIDRTSPGLPLHGSAPRASSAPSPVANSNAPSTPFPLPTPTPPSVRPPAGTTQAAAPSSSAAPPVIGSAHTVLPKETRPATSSLSSHKSSPHPVKPLNAPAPQGEKKPEGRSVLASGLEKLKSTIHPGRASQQGEPEAERNKSLSESTARYGHLTNNEIVALLLQREAELEKQGEEFEKQGVLLEKREVELKKMKLQVRDMEDYIDRLLVRIMEQTPTLLQVRSRFK